jgi:hypothetical protein
MTVAADRHCRVCRQEYPSTNIYIFVFSVPPYHSHPPQRSLSTQDPQKYNKTSRLKPKEYHSWPQQNQSRRSESGTQSLPKASFLNWLQQHQVLLVLYLVRRPRKCFQRGIQLREQCCVPVSYPSLQPPTNTAFRCYARKKTKTDKGDQGKKASDEHVDDQKDLLVVGESDKIEYISTKEESQRAADAGCR